MAKRVRSRLIALHEGRIFSLVKNNTKLRLGLAGGEVKSGETYVQGLLREVSEETSVQLSENDVMEVSVVQTKNGEGEKLEVHYFELSQGFDVAFKNNEPHKCIAVEWVPLDVALEFLNKTDRNAVLIYLDTKVEA